MEAREDVPQQEKEQAAINVLFDDFCKKYHELALFIQNLPLNAELKSKVVLFMDTGFLWTKEAFVHRQVEAQKAKLEAVPDQELPVE